MSLCDCVEKSEEKKVRCFMKHYMEWLDSRGIEYEKVKMGCLLDLPCFDRLKLGYFNQRERKTIDYVEKCLFYAFIHEYKTDGHPYIARHLLATSWYQELEQLVSHQNQLLQ